MVKLPEIEQLQETAFSSVLTVLRALAANDDRIVEYFRAISQGRKSTGGIIDFGVDVVKGVSLDSEKFISSIELNLWSRLAKLSWRPFEEARELVRSLGLKSWDEWNKFIKENSQKKEHAPKIYHPVHKTLIRIRAG